MNHHPISAEEAQRLADIEAAAQPRGPYAPTIVLGLLGLVVAVAVLLREAAGLAIDLAEWGPWIVVGLGAVLLLVGVAGIARRGR